MIKRFTDYTHNAIDNYTKRCKRLKKGIEIAEKGNDKVSAKKYRAELFNQRAYLFFWFVFSLCCLYIVVFGLPF